MTNIYGKLTASQIEEAKPKDRDYKLTDGAGLSLQVTRSGSKRWRFRYFYEGREKLVSFGLYPEVSLDEARARRKDYRKALRNGEDPADKRIRASEVVLEDAYQRLLAAKHHAEVYRFITKRGDNILDAITLELKNYDQNRRS